MAYQIDIDESCEVPPGTAVALVKAVATILDEEAVDQAAGLTVLLADDGYLRSLNDQFRQEDHPTDVLSFPAGDTMPGMPDEGVYLGDIAISVPYAQRQADRRGHALMDELQLLAVHGTLHLLGYDHATDEEKTEMWARQELVLGLLGLSHVQPTEGDGEPEH
ncbi:MAG: rRNA maturation RNase YbeY [Chloroflexota bacterium]